MDSHPMSNSQNSDLESAGEAPSSHMSHISQVPMSSEMSSVMSSSVTSPSVDRSAPRSSGGLSIGSLVHPQSDYRFMATPAFSNHPRSLGHFVSGFPSSDESGIFYTPESSQSPVSDNYGRYPHRQSISSSSSVIAFDPSGASPLISGTIPGTWVPSSAPPSMLPSSIPEDGSYLPVCAPFLWSGICTEADQSPADSSIPIPLSDLDGYEYSVIRRELSNAPGILFGSSTVGISDAIRWECLDLYWQHFHPHFPIVHRPTFLPTKPSPLLASAMAAIGSQYDTRSDAKHYSLTLLEIATRLLRRRDNITSRSRLADLQTVFLLEVLSKYCARRTEVDMSARFRSLFASLDQARRSLATDPLAVFRTLRPDYSPDDLARAHKFWLEHETRRRILQASMVLDLQQVTLFEQPPTIIHHGRSRKSGPALRTSISLPCSEDLWETSPIGSWSKMAAETDVSKSRVTRNDNSALEAPLDCFQLQVSLANAQDTSLDTFLVSKNQNDNLASCLAFNHHAREMARNIPVRQLLIVSGESWVLGRKLEDEAEFQDAKRNLRVWIDSDTECKTALWHAVRLLRSRVMFTPADANNIGLHASFVDTHMLHEPWVLYLAGLVCWAHGSSSSRGLDSGGQVSGAPSSASTSLSNPSRPSSHSSLHPPLLDSHEAAYSMRQYLDVMAVDHVESLKEIDPQNFGLTHGLLEILRIEKLGKFLGGLMNDGERVLYRLVEGRSRLTHF